jgi:RHS repeat-associated protein
LSSSGHNGSSLDTVSTLNSLANSQQSFTLDAVGNQSSVTTDGTATSRTVNSQNQITALGSSSLAYDNNGNTTTDDQGHTLIYDAWNRLLQVKNGSTTLTTYAFDASGWRIIENSGTAADIYFSFAGQAIEERQGSTVTKQYVWGLGYVNDIVLRDDNSSSGSYGKSSSGLGRRLYYQQDANYNVTALTNTSGTAMQRYLYTPYGVASVLSGSWGSSSDSYGNVIENQGERFDPTTGMSRSGIRDDLVRLGTWAEADPIDYVDGDDRYQFEDSNPVTGLDPSGLWNKNFHYKVIKFLHKAKCWSDADAEKAAKASQAVDDNPQTDPVALGTKGLLENLFSFGLWAPDLDKLADYHFPGSKRRYPGPQVGTQANDPNSRQHLMDLYAQYGQDDFDFDALGRWLHTYADSWAHAGYSAYPSLIADVGHLLAGHDPDITSKHLDAAMDAAKHIFDLIPSKCSCPTKFSDIEGKLRDAFKKNQGP